MWLRLKGPLRLMSVETLSTGIEASGTGDSLNSGDPAVHPAARHRLYVSGISSEEFPALVIARSLLCLACITNILKTVIRVTLSYTTCIEPPVLTATEFTAVCWSWFFDRRDIM